MTDKPLTAPAEALLDEFFGTVDAPNAYFRPSDWAEDPSNVRLQLERIEAAAAQAAIEPLLRLLADCAHDLWDDWETTGGPRTSKAAVDAALAATRSKP